MKENSEGSEEHESDENEEQPIWYDYFLARHKELQLNQADQFYGKSWELLSFDNQIVGFERVSDGEYGFNPIWKDGTKGNAVFTTRCTDGTWVV